MKLRLELLDKEKNCRTMVVLLFSIKAFKRKKRKEKKKDQIKGIIIRILIKTLFFNFPSVWYNNNIRPI